MNRSRPPSLASRSLRHHWRSNLAVALGVAVATSVLTGALLVGDSMRGSLRAAALARLGLVEFAMTAPRFVREALADEIARRDPGGRAFIPVVALRGGATHAGTSARAERVRVLGVDERFAAAGPGRAWFAGAQRDRVVVLNEPLARELGARVGDEVLLRLGKPGDASPETLMGRRDATTVSLRLTVREVLAPGDAADFSTEAAVGDVRNAFVPLRVLQQAIHRSGRANAILAATTPALPDRALPKSEALFRAFERSSVRASLSTADLGVRVRLAGGAPTLVVECESVLMEPAIEQAVLSAAQRLGLSSAGVFAHLANRIERAAPQAGSAPAAPQAAAPRPAPTIPYSTVAGVEDASELPLADGSRIDALGRGAIILNEWAAGELDARPGDAIGLTYYVAGAFGRLETHEAIFTLAGVARLEGAAADPAWVPEYPGVTDSPTIADWNPPFPVDLNAVRPRDEDYWERHRATPKAFVSLADAQELWAERAVHLGSVTSVRVHLPPEATREQARSDLEEAIVANVDPCRLGLTFEPVRRQAIERSAGTTDFGLLFLGFSAFLVASAAMLVGLLFRLGVERRAGEVGILLAAGWTRRNVARLLVSEALCVAAGGAGSGLLGAAAYATLMLAGLSTWWADAAQAPALRLHVGTFSLAAGFAGSLLLAVGAIGLALRGLTKAPPRALLAGGREISGAAGRRGPAVARGIGIACLLAAGGLAGANVADPQRTAAAAFFCAGALMLLGMLALLSAWLRTASPRRALGSRMRGGLALGVRGLRRAPRRSLLTAGLMACATYLISAVGAFRLETNVDTADKHAGGGGFALLGEATTPLLHDLDADAGREALALSDVTSERLARARVFALRLRPGDETSCLGLYQPRRPRIAGATDAFIEQGAFGFAGSLARTPPQRANPWLLLRERFDDETIPAIGDEAAVRWQLHKGLGEDLTITDERGRERRLRFVALLSGSALQSEILVAEDRFRQMFPSISGYGLFLIQAAADDAAPLGRALERDLERFGFDVEPVTARLRAYAAVQNTYLSAFQTLGGLGLVLGTLGMGAVLLRNVWERRGELALLRAVGWPHAAIARLVLAENAALTLIGLLIGLASALVAVAPQLAGRAAAVPWALLAATLMGVVTMSLTAGWLALRPVLRAPLVAGLRSE